LSQLQCLEGPAKPKSASKYTQRQIYFNRVKIKSQCAGEKTRKQILPRPTTSSKADEASSGINLKKQVYDSKQKFAPRLAAYPH